MGRRLLFSVVGTLLGLLAGTFAFYLTREQGTAFSWFLPGVFAAVFAVVSLVAGERSLDAVGEIVSRL